MISIKKCAFAKYFAIYLLTQSMLSCTQKKTELAWNKSLPKIGSQSSPRTSDLNGDGILDLVMGGGVNEYQESNFGVFAINGSNGEVLWNHKSIDQIYGSPTFVDATQDGIDDLIIGGRSNQLMALNGKDGSLLWQYDGNSYKEDTILQYAQFNFHNSVLIPDQNGDGIPEVLVQNGGNPKAAPYETENRFPGVLMIINPVNGDILFADKTPDLLESYTPPLYFKQKDGSEYIVFGTGGETISGSLYLATLEQLKTSNLKSSEKLFTEFNHGFVAPPNAADLNQDGFLDIIAASHASTIFAIDGKTFNFLWKQKVPETETSNALAMGNFNGDDIPDLFTFVSRGVWPESKGSVQVMLDGATGAISYTNNLGCTGFSSPVIYDLNGDGIDEAIISLNEYDCERGFTNKNPLESISNKLIAINFADEKVKTIDVTPRFKNIFSTPWIGDLDGDNYLDIVYSQFFNADSDVLLFFGMQMKRISTSISCEKPVKWGAYMNSKGDGVFR